MDEEKFLKEHTETNLFKQVLYKYLPYWPLFVITTAISLGIAFFNLRSAPRIFVANAKVLLKDPNKGSGDAKILEALNIFSEKKIVENEILVLRSSGLMSEVVKELGLYALVGNEGRVRKEELYNGNAPVWFTTDQPLKVYPSNKYYFSIDWNNKFVRIDNKRVAFNSSVVINNSVFKITINPDYRQNTGKNFFVQFNSIAGTAGGLLGSISANALSRVSTVIDITMQTINPAKGVAVLTKLFEIYNRSAIRDKNQIAAQTLSFIEDRLRLVILQLDSVERNLSNYKTLDNVVELGTQAQLYFGNVKELDKSKSEIELQLGILNDINSYVRNKGSIPGTVPSLLLVNDPTLSGLLSKLYEAEFDYEKASSLGGEKSNSVLLADQKVRRIKADILENMANIRNGLLTQKKELIAGVEKNNSLLLQIPKKERAFLEISRQQVIKNNIYTFLLQKREETALSSAATTADLKVIEPANAYGPISPISKNYYLTGLVIGILSAASLILVKEFFSNKILFRKEIEDKTGIPIVGELVQVLTKQAYVIQDGRRSVVAEQFRSLRTNLSFMGLNAHNKTVLITSSISGEGKSFIAVNLAISFTLTGKKVALLELDLRKPKLSKLMKVKNNPGISNYLIGKASLNDIIKSTEIKDLCLISSGPIPPNPTELILKKEFKAMIDELKTRFDYVIIDTAPVAPVADAQLLQEHCDINVFVVRHNVTPRLFLPMLNGLMRQKKFNNMCIIFNGIKPRGFYMYGYGLGGYGNSYGYGHGYEYSGKSYGGYYFEEKKKLLQGFKNVFKRNKG